MAMRQRSVMGLMMCLGLLLQLSPGLLPAFERAPAELDAVRGLAAEREIQTVERVNAFFNGFRRESDDRLWGRVDYWAVPDELMRTGAGDCEDLAIAKYFALREAGVDARRLRLVYGQAYRADKGRIESHIVLLYRAGQAQRWWVLDNLVETLEPLATRADLSLTLSFNEYQVARWRSGADEQVLGSARLLTPWAEVLARHGLLRGSASLH